MPAANPPNPPPEHQPEHAARDAPKARQTSPRRRCVQFTARVTRARRSLARRASCVSANRDADVLHGLDLRRQGAQLQPKALRASRRRGARSASWRDEKQARRLPSAPKRSRRDAPRRRRRRAAAAADAGGTSSSSSCAAAPGAFCRHHRLSGLHQPPAQRLALGVAHGLGEQRSLGEVRRRPGETASMGAHHPPGTRRATDFSPNAPSRFSPPPPTRWKPSSARCAASAAATARRGGRHGEGEEAVQVHEGKHEDEEHQRRARLNRQCTRRDSSTSRGSRTTPRPAGRRRARTSPRTGWRLPDLTRGTSLCTAGTSKTYIPRRRAPTRMRGPTPRRGTWPALPSPPPEGPPRRRRRERARMARGRAGIAFVFMKRRSV